MRAYVPCFHLGKPINGYGMGEVIQSKKLRFPIGSLVVGVIIWEHFSHIPPTAIRDSKVPLSRYMGALGITGLTAYGSFKLYGNLKPGSDEKVKIILEELKFDAAINYKSGKPIVESLREAYPEGLDIYYDNVGGEQLEAALEVLKRYGRVVVSSMFDDYNRLVLYHIKNLVLVFQKRIKIEGFLCLDFEKELSPAFRRM
ncbi:hypothetical protein BGZ47_011773 [Haplosporangium gracile]|nr:hypothetical protein BGZ47_011773 [Haplosporangium gracile]